MTTNINTLVASMKSIVLTAKEEGFTPREAIQAILAFCNILEASGANPDALFEACQEVAEWMETTQLLPLEGNQRDASLN